MSEIEREKRERKLVALMLNDLSGDMGAEDASKMRQEVGDLSEGELRGTLARRMDLHDGATDEELDDALAFVEEPEILSPDDIGSAPDMSHGDEAEGSR